MSSEFKNLNLNRDMILQVARQFMVDKSEGWEIEDKLVCVATYQSRLIMRLNGKREFLDIWVRNDGSTTLGYSGGSRENLEFRKELCKYIAEQCSLPAEVSKKTLGRRSMVLKKVMLGR